ncbi:MAG: hypothetical protein QOI74_446 [Micromonosporaceae bacterium]|nr:hypothetical protein [Micromonosporaceae bacterium]
MPTRLLLEGSDIQQLLAQVREAHGATAKIVSADRVRPTGLMGLFGRQRYELTVEVADDAAGPAASQPPPGPAASHSPPGPAASHFQAGLPASHFQAGLPAATIAYQGALAAAGTAGIPGGVPAPPPPAAGVHARDGQGPADALIALVEEEERQQFGYAGRHETTVSDPPIDPAANRTPRPDRATDGPAEVRADRAVDPVVGMAADPPTPSAPTAGGGEQATAGALAFADVLSGLGIPGWPSDHQVPDSPVDPFAVPPPHRATARTPQPEPAVNPQPRAAAATDAQPRAAAATDAQPPPADDAPVVIPRYQPARLPADTPLTTILAALGLPPELCDRVTGFDSYRAIVAVVELLPAPPAVPSGGGDVLMIVGELAGAMATAHTVAERLGLPPTDTLLAAGSFAGTGTPTERRLTGRTHAVGQVAELRTDATAPIIIVVDAPADGTGTVLARSIVDGVDATAVWAVVDATRKTADSARLLAGIGRVDAIAVHGWAATAEPAAVLRLGLPVVLLDGDTPTPHRWAAQLCQRLEGVVAR